MNLFSEANAALTLLPKGLLSKRKITVFEKLWKSLILQHCASEASYVHLQRYLKVFEPFSDPFGPSLDPLWTVFGPFWTLFGPFLDPLQKLFGSFSYHVEPLFNTFEQFWTILETFWDNFRYDFSITWKFVRHFYVIFRHYIRVKKSPIWVLSRDGPKHEGGPLKNLKGKALTEVPTIVFDCAYVGSSVEAPSPRWWGAKWHQRWHMTSLKLEFNIYGARPN